jgi:hypothetical protein
VSAVIESEAGDDDEPTMQARGASATPLPSDRLTSIGTEPGIS